MEDQATSSRKADLAGPHLEIVANIVCAYVSHNSLRAADLPELIATIHSSMTGLTKETSEPPAAVPQVPAVPVKKSVTPEFIICLEDGKKFRSLKRHIGTVYNLSPDQYREKWGLAADYPMVAPAYSAIRSKLAKDIGLGQQHSPANGARVPAEPKAEAEPEPKPARAKRAKSAQA